MKKYPDKKLKRKYFPKNIAIITGITQAGKSMLEPIVASFDRSEIVQFNFLMEQFPLLNNAGYLSDDVAVYLLRYALDFMQYDLFIGRNANFRPTDMSSIWKAKDPSLYFKRLFAPEGDIVYEEISRANPVQILNIHYGLWHIDIFLKAFPGVKIIHLRRHPVDLIHIWYQKGYGKDFSENIRCGVLTIQHGNKLIPYFAMGWEKQYLNLSEIDRIIYMINNIERNQQKKFNALSEKGKKQLLVLYFEDVVTNPKSAVKKLCQFLNLKETLYTPIALEKEKCPRVLNKEDRKTKLNEIKQLASKKSIKILSSMTEDYENKRKLKQCL